MPIFTLSVMVFLIVFCFSNGTSWRDTSGQTVRYDAPSILWFLCGIFLVIMLILMLVGKSTLG